MGLENLKNSLVVIAGASGRLGRYMVKEFVSREARVVGLVRATGGPAEVRNPDEGKVKYFPADAASEIEVRAAFDRIRAEYGRIYACINAIGMWGTDSFAQTSFDAWRTMNDVNLTTTFLLFREALKHMEGGAGRLIAVASAQGADRAQAKQAGYAASKAGVIRLVEAVGAEYRDGRITAHVIAPSTILYDGSSEERGVFAADLADMAAYLCGPAGQALNGATLRAYGTDI